MFCGRLSNLSVALGQPAVDQVEIERFVDLAERQNEYQKRSMIEARALSALAAADRSDVAAACQQCSIASTSSVPQPTST